MAITSLSLILSSGVSLYSQISIHKQSLHKNVVIFAEMIGRGALDPIIKNEGWVAEQNLKTLAASELIENVHIYKLTDQHPPNFFASYNKEGIAPVKVKIDLVNTLTQPKITGSVIEVIRPIRNDDQVMGYVYLRASVDILENLITRSIITTVSVLLICLLLCFLLILKLQSTITTPIDVLV